MCAAIILILLIRLVVNINKLNQSVLLLEVLEANHVRNQFYRFQEQSSMRVNERRIGFVAQICAFILFEWHLIGKTTLE